MDEQRIRRLQRARSRGSTSILSNCTGRDDVDRCQLREAIGEAEHRVAHEVPIALAEATLRNLDRIAEAVIVQGASSVALFAWSEMTDVVHLDVEAPSRVVVDDTFATRDLLLALNHQPTVHVVTLGEHRTRCFEGSGTHLQELRNDQFPMTGETRAGSAHEEGSGSRWRSIEESARIVERRLRTTLADDATPLVLFGSARRMAAVSGRAWVQRRPTSQVVRQMERATPAELSDQVAPIAASLVADRRT